MSIERRIGRGQSCPTCFRHSRRSSLEIALGEHLSSRGHCVIASDRKLLRGKEIDLWMPELRVAIEVNGDYWHSDVTSRRLRSMGAEAYHRSKAEACGRMGIQLLFIWERDLVEHGNAVRGLLDAHLDAVTVELSLGRAHPPVPPCLGKALGPLDAPWDYGGKVPLPTATVFPTA